MLRGCRKREDEWKQQKSAISEAHRRQTLEAQNAHKAQLSAAKSQLDLVQAALAQVEGVRPEYVALCDTFEDELEQATADLLPELGPGGGVEGRAGQGMEALQQLAREGGRAAAAVGAALGKAEQVLQQLCGTKEELRREEAAENPHAQKLQW